MPSSLQGRSGALMQPYAHMLSSRQSPNIWAKPRCLARYCIFWLVISMCGSDVKTVWPSGLRRFSRHHAERAGAQTPHPSLFQAARCALFSVGSSKTETNRGPVKLFRVGSVSIDCGADSAIRDPHPPVRPGISNKTRRTSLHGRHKGENL